VQRSEWTPQTFIEAGQFTEIAGSRFFSVATGESSRQFSVVYLHGIPSWSWLWRHVLPETALWTKSIAIDLPGFGVSERRTDGSFQVPDLAESVELLLDRTVGYSEPVSLVAHDFGALVGAELVGRNPDRYRNLVLTNTSLRTESWLGGGPLRVLSVPGLGQLSMWLARPWMLQLAMLPFVADSAARTGPAFDGYWFPFRRAFGQNLARFYQQRPVQADDFERLRDVLRSFSGRTLICWGALDPAFTTEEVDDIRSLLPKYPESIVFEHASHFLPEDRPAALGRCIRAFLANE
jgi:haloalkane dehalogenase